MARKWTLSLALLLASVVAHADTTPDADGFTNPLEQLQFNPYLDQREL